MRLRSFLRKLDSRRRDRKKRPELAAFAEAIAGLSEGDVAIDCGANVGIYSKRMAEPGATVYAFEPNPAAYAALVENTARWQNVKTFQAAVTTEAGRVRLYLHQWAADDPLRWSTGSSLVAGKKNVGGEFVEVEGIPLARFIRQLGRRVRLLKMDVEGAEVAILNQILDEGLHEVIDQAFVEVHDRKIPELAGPTQRLRERLAAAGATHFRLDWR
jgi:FkbM family methyltransferase